MYSKEMLKILRKNKIKIGDKVEVLVNNRKIQGILMPKPETSDPNCIILKLDDGYNIGVKIKSQNEIRKCGEEK